MSDRSMRLWSKMVLAICLLVAGCSSATAPAVAPPPGTTASERQAMFLRGARLWPVKCMQCHNARPGAQFSPAQWQQIIMHMRTLANLPPQDARAVAYYLEQSH